MIVLLLLASLTGVASAQEDLAGQLRETREQLQRKESELDRTRQELEVVSQEVRDADAKLAVMAAELGELEAELAAARSALDDARRRSEAATAELARVTQRLEETRQRLAEREALLAGRAAATYKYGQVSYAQVVLGARDIGDLLNGMVYVRSVMSADRVIIEEVSETTRQLVADRAVADRLRDEVRREEARAATQEAELERLTARQRELTAQARAEKARRAELMHKLEAQEAHTAEEIAELEAESAAIEEKIRQSRWRAGAPGKGQLVWPTSGRVTSGYGTRTHPIYGGQRMHTGIDIGAPSGQPIVAAAEGLVIVAYCTPGGYGCRVVLDHGGGLATLSAHMSRFAVGEGAVVGQGQVIGYVGSTGASTGPHLHFEVRVNGEPRNPMDWY